MPVTIRNTDILFNNGTTQSTAATPVSTDFGAVGTYAVLLNATESDLAVNGTRAGSQLRIDPALNSGSWLANQSFMGARLAANTTYDGGGSAPSGTWRKMSQGQIYRAQPDGYGGTNRYYGWGLYVRIF